MLHRWGVLRLACLAMPLLSWPGAGSSGGWSWFMNEKHSHFSAMQQTAQ
jgi:hypothetical protein